MIRPALIAVSVLLAPLPAARAGELPRSEPGAVGLSAARLAELKPTLQKIVDDGKIAGGVALVARHGKVVEVVACGYRDLASKTPMTEDTIFAIASMTKPITCVAAMILVEQEKLWLDDPVSKYLPELKDLRVLGDDDDDTETAVATVPARRPVTVRDLFTHTSGFAYGGFLSGNARLGRSYARAGVQDRELKTVAEQVTRLAGVPLAHQPGEQWTYGLSHDVLGRIIEVVSGQHLDRYLQEHILTPLDMHDTCFSVPEAKRDRVATIYHPGGGGTLAAMPKNYGSETFFSGGAGLFSTARDYARFAQMLLNDGALDGIRILRPATIDAMTTNQIGRLMAMGMKYGLGFGLELTPESGLGNFVVGRYFWGGLFSTNFWVDPRHDVVAVIMTQVVPTNHGNANSAFRKVVDAAIER
jgi:CubicO group peptidase (beta-lactamase class C family)